MIKTQHLSAKPSPVIPLIRKVGQLMIAGLILMVTVISGVIAGLIGILVRGQLPDTEAFESAPKRQDSP